MDATFHEKSLWGQLAGLVLVYGYYFFRVLGTSMSEMETLILFIGAVVVLVILQVVYHVLLSMTFLEEAQQASDERDRLISLKATRIASYVLATGAVVSASLWIFGITPLGMANAILLSLVLAQVVDAVMQLVYYRRGV